MQCHNLSPETPLFPTVILTVWDVVKEASEDLFSFALNIRLSGGWGRGLCDKTTSPMRERLVVEYANPGQNIAWGRLAPGKRCPTLTITDLKVLQGVSRNSITWELFYKHDANSGLLCGHNLTGHLDGRSLKQRPARGYGGAVIRENMASESKERERVCVWRAFDPWLPP